MNENAIDRRLVCAFIGGLISDDGERKKGLEYIRNMSAVNPQEPKTGHWIVHEKPHGIRFLECPYCNIWYLNEHLIRNSFCPNCGARMIEPQKRSDKE